MKTVSLQNVLRLNAASSAATGIILVTIPNLVSDLFEVRVGWPFVESGIFLIAFSLLVFYTSRTNPIQHKLVRIVIVLDSLWVIASAILLLLRPFQISLIGSALIGAVALWVTAMAYLQYNGWKDYAINVQR